MYTILHRHPCLISVVEPEKAQQRHSGHSKRNLRARRVNNDGLSNIRRDGNYVCVVNRDVDDGLKNLVAITNAEDTVNGDEVRMVVIPIP